MRAPLGWLSELCPHGRPPAEAAELLRTLGHDPEGIEKDVLLLEITANRPDCLSLLGLAHELAAATGVPVRAPDATPPPEGGAPPPVRVEDPSGCPLYAARAIRGVRVGPSPEWLARRLEAMGLKPLCNVVDVTNYVMFETGQPLHAFDAGRLDGGIVVRRARAGEHLSTLDGADRALSPDALVIADAARPAALAGVIGGADSAVTDATRDLILESALFDPRLIRRTARALGVVTDSSYRFERGVDPQGVLAASARAARLLVECCGGEASAAAAAGAPPAPPSPFRLRRKRLAALLGCDIPPAEAARILRGLGCGLEDMPEGWQVTAPSRRARDLRTEAEAAEEVARVWGYDRIPGRIGLPARPGRPDAARDFAAEVSERLRAAGFCEAVTPSFGGAEAGGPALANPMSSDQTHLRAGLVPGLLKALVHNQNVGEGGGRLFEMGRAFPPEGEVWRLALAGHCGLREAKGALASALGARIDRERVLTPGGRDVGRVWLPPAGDLRDAVAAAEIDLEPLLRERTGAAFRFAPLPRFPSVVRDLAVVVDESLPWSTVERTVLTVPCAFRESLSLFDLYRGRQVGAGRKSLAFSIVFRHPDRTLAGEEVDRAMAAVVSALERDCGGQVRA